MHGQPVNTPPRSRQSTSTPTDVAVNLAPPHPVVILCPSCWRSYLVTLPHPAGILHYLLLVVIFTPACPSVISNPPLDGHIHPGLPSGHPLTLLLAVIFTPARPAVILLLSCWHSYAPLHKLRSSSNPPAGGHIHPCPPNSHPLPLLLAVTFIPPYPQINTNPEVRLTVPDFTISLYGS